MGIPKFEHGDQAKEWLREHPYYCAKPFYTKHYDAGSWCCHWRGKLDNDLTPFLNETPVPQCKLCYQLDEVGDISERINDSAFISVSHHDWLDDLKPQHIELQLDNVCNAACRMCNSGNSALWGKTIGDPYKTTHINLTPKIIEELKTVRHLVLIGGETMLSSKLHTILDQATKVEELAILTNCSVYKKDIMDRLDQLPQVNFTLSIDAIGKVNDYTRWPLKWDKLERNIKRFMQHKLDFIASPAFHIYNVFHIREQMDFWMQYMEPGNLVLNPKFQVSIDWMRIDILPQDVLDELNVEIEELKTHEIFTRYPMQTDILLEALNSITQMKSIHTPELWNKFVENNSRWDKAQNMTLEEYVPELYRRINV